VINSSKKQTDPLYRSVDTRHVIHIGSDALTAVIDDACNQQSDYDDGEKNKKTTQVEDGQCPIAVKCTVLIDSPTRRFTVSKPPDKTCIGLILMMTNAAWQDK
jgi:hypothetical protein